MSSCDERRVEQWDLESWWSYVQADRRSEAFRRYLADGLTRTWADRPDAVTRIPNLSPAADYVRTHTDLATMEGANEAARRAVNGILDATRSTARRCELWALREPPAFGAARLLDRVLWRLRRPAPSPLRVTVAGELEPAGVIGHALSLFRR